MKIKITDRQVPFTIDNKDLYLKKLRLATLIHRLEVKGRLEPFYDFGTRKFGKIAHGTEHD